MSNLKMIITIDFITSTTKQSFGGGIIFGSVCLSVCLSVCEQNSGQSIEQIAAKITLNMPSYPISSWLNFEMAQLQERVKIWNFVKM